MKHERISAVYTIDGGGDVDACIKLAHTRICQDFRVDSIDGLPRVIRRVVDEIDDVARSLRHPRVVESVEDKDGNPVRDQSDPTGRRQLKRVVDEGDGVQGKIMVVFEGFGPLATESRT